MRIQSKFKDYYDFCATYGIDQTLVYERETEEDRHRSPYYGYMARPQGDVLKAPFREIDQACRSLDSRIQDYSRAVFSGDIYWSCDMFRDRRKYRITKFVLGFCGTLYPAFSVEYHCEDGSMGGADKKAFCLNENQIWDVLRENPQSENNHIRVFLEDRGIQEAFKTASNTDIFHALNCPIFVATPGWYRTNVCLRDYRFQEIVDGTQAFQQIGSFISGVLRSGDTMPPNSTTDVQLAQAKGFNDRSFRKEPTKRKP